MMRSSIMKSPEVVVVILNWNGKEDTTLCLRSLANLKYDHVEIIVVDNGSKDGSVEFLRSEKGITLIENGANLGFAAGNNVGIRYAINKLKPDYVFLLNNDTECDPDMLTHLVRTAESSSQIGIVSPKICYFDNPNKIWSIGGNGIFKTVLLGDSIKGQGDSVNYVQDRPVDYVWSCGMLIKENVIHQIGLLDEDYFVSMEDIDYCKRARDAGFEIWVSSRAKLLHKVSSSTGGDNYTPIIRYYYAKGMVLFMKKHALLREWMLFFPIVLMSLVWAMPREFYRNNQKAVFEKIRGLKDGFMTAPHPIQKPLR
ncbi:MAG: glycosyltransferase family 2 protein [Deltaproteobacteria bacterium]|nr:glycosyltransferase family 2 protein [Deltaproteobacteria bacterium]